MGQTGFCENLAVFCENLRFPAVFCENPRLRSARIPRKKSENLQKSAEICEKKTANSARSVPFSLSLFIGAEIWEGDERRKFQVLESTDSLNDRNLFSELPFL